MASMTSEAIAEVVANLWWERDDPVSEGRKGIAQDFAEALGRADPAFDKKKFFKKCGVRT